MLTRLLPAALLAWSGAAHALEPVDPNATPEARALLQYLSDLPNSSNNRVVSGQTIHGDLRSQFDTYVKGFGRITGSQPGLVQVMLYADWLKKRDHRVAHRSDGAVFPLSYNHANRGGHVMWIYRPNNPFNGRGNASLIPGGRAFSEVYTPGTPAYEIWQEDLQMLALQAGRLDAAGIPVTICMFGGYNSNAARWHNVRSNPGSSWKDFRTAWRVGVKTLRQAGVHNVLWCLEEADSAKSYRLLGWQEKWVDIQSIQAAHDNESSGPLDLYTAHIANSSKPIVYGQFLLKAPLRTNPPSYRYRNAIDLIRDSMPRIAAIVPWSADNWGDPSDLREHSPVFHLETKAYADDPWIANRGELGAVFGRTRRAVLPTGRAAVPMDGKHIENFVGTDSSWVPGGNGALTVTDGGDGILDAFYFGDDPVLKRSARNMGARFDRLRVRLRNNALADRIELSWRRTTDADWGTDRRVSIPVDPMGLYLKEYTADLSGHPQWNGTIRQLRLHLNPDHRWGSAEIDYIGFDTGGGQSPKALANAGFEKSLGIGWFMRDAGRKDARLARYSRSKRSGNHSMLAFMRDRADDGVAQDVTGVLANKGPGTYRFGAYFRLPSTVGPNRQATIRAVLSVLAGGERTAYRIDGIADRHGWTPVSGAADVLWTGALEDAKLIFRTVGTSEDILLDDAFLTFENAPPSLGPIGDQTVEARQTLRIEVAATDDGPAPLVLSASGLPQGARFTDQGSGAGLLEWTPGDGDVSGEPYAVTFSATDDGGSGLTDLRTVEITVTEYPWEGELVGGISDPGSTTLDLTSAGKTDWKHFARENESSINRKAGVRDLIGGYARVGTPTVSRLSGSSSPLAAVSWTDGMPTATEDGTPARLVFQGEGEGYSLSLPADERPKTARLYIGGDSVVARIEGRMSDGSAPVFSKTIRGESLFDAIVALDYAAGSGGQTLDVSVVIEEDLGSGNVTLAAVALTAPILPPYAQDFDDDRADNWSEPRNDSSAGVNWSVSGGAMRQSVQVGYGGAFEESYHVGTYRYLVDGEGLRDYRARVTITPEDATVFDDFGLMFRYRDPDNYYRLSQSARFGYTRLEKRSNGVFSTLGVTAIGYEPGQPTTYEVEVVGPTLLVWIDGQRVFAVRDSTHGRGSIALYTTDAVSFDDVTVEPPAATPYIAISEPLARVVVPGNALRVEALALNKPAGAEIVIEVDGYAPRRFSSPPYVVNLDSVPRGEYGVTARLLERPDGNPLSAHAIGSVAVGGRYGLAFGDSNTLGLGDSFMADNRLVSRIRGVQGYGGTLASRLDQTTSFPSLIFNEGISGDTTDVSRFVRLSSLLERHDDATEAYVALGTNDISAQRASGEGCAFDDAACLDDTIRGDLQAIVDEMRAAGLSVWTATVPPAWPRRGEPAADSARMLLTREVNRAIREGVSGDRVGPDLFGFFYADTDGDLVPDLPRQSLYGDRYHFNGLGHHIVALLWHNALVGEASGTSVAPFFLSEPSVAGYQQNLLDPGDDVRIDDFETLVSFPPVLADGIWVMTAQADAGSTGSTFLQFSVADRPVDVYVAYDTRAPGLPDWLDPALSPFRAVNGVDVVTSATTYRLFVRSYAAGETIGLGGNVAADDRMYIPIVVDASDGR